MNLELELRQGCLSLQSLNPNRVDEMGVVKGKFIWMEVGKGCGGVHQRC